MEIGTIIYGLIVSALVLALIRELICWYWKINTIVTEQQKQTELLKQILEVLKDTNGKSTP